MPADLTPSTLPESGTLAVIAAALTAVLVKSFDLISAWRSGRGASKTAAVNASDARDKALWDQGEDLRHALHEELHECRESREAQDRQIAALTERADQAQVEAAAAKRAVDALREELMQAEDACNQRIDGAVAAMKVQFDSLLARLPKEGPL
jgi:chromosome segregation ATPase